MNKLSFFILLCTYSITAQEVPNALTSQNTSQVKIEYQKPYTGELISQNDTYKVIANYDDGYILNKDYYQNANGKLAGSVIYLVDNFIYKKIYRGDDILTEYKLKNGKLEDDYTLIINDELKYSALFDKGILQEGSIAIIDVGVLPNYKADQNKKKTFTVLTLKKKTLKIEILEEQTNTVLYKMTTKIKKNKQFLNTIHSKLITPENLYPERDLNHLDNTLPDRFFTQQNN